jgi:palmitoyltransferase
MMTGGCVGLANQRFFIVFLIWASIGSAYGAVYNFRYLNRFVAPWYPFGWANYIAPFALVRWILGHDTFFNFFVALMFSAATASSLGAAAFCAAQVKRICLISDSIF